MKDLHSIDIDQVNNILFFGQNTRRTSHVSSIVDTLDITAESLFYVVLRFSIQNEKKKITAIYMYPLNMG